MIKGTLTRGWLNPKQTLGTFVLYDDDKEGGKIFQCYTCEDPVRGNGDPNTVAKWKIKGDSAIPYGTYKVRRTMSSRFKREMRELQNVPGFAGIRIHAGNTAKDTEGCLLFGKFINGDYNGITHSKVAIAEFEALLANMGNPEWELEVV